MFWPNSESIIMNIIRQTSLIVLLATAILATAGCGNMSSRDKSTAAGAGIGAVGGAILTGGSAVGTVGGAAVGGVIGSQVGKD
jgi:osmotically inducible lipoprotein OsmB|tara:strand:- start:179 stop:427 length:249 start_codon:yes stop_codon:yes gene_type:complete